MAHNPVGILLPVIEVLKCFARKVRWKLVTDTPLSSVSNAGRTFCNLRFANDIDMPGSSEEEVQQLTQRLQETVAE